MARRWYLFPICLLAICGTAVFIGAVPTRVFGHDVFFLLDNGWRVINGQRPHIDYSSPWGPVTFLIAGVGLLISRFTADGIGYGNALFGLLIGLWSHRIGRERLEPIPRILASLYLVLLVVAPYPLGRPVHYLSHAMVPNRYGYALLGLILLESSLEGRTREKEDWFGGISAGAATALVLFLKISYFFGAVLLIGGFALLRGLSRQRLPGIVIGFSLVAIPLLVYLRFDVWAILRDWNMAAHARAEGVLFGDLGRKFLVNTPYLLLLVYLAIRGSSAERANQEGHRNFHLLRIGALVFAADIIVIFGNQQDTQLPLSILFSLIVISRVVSGNRTCPEKETSFHQPVYRVTLFAAGMFFLIQFALQVSALGYGAFLKAHPSLPPAATRFAVPRLVPLLLYDGLDAPNSNGRKFTTYVNEGIELLRKNSRPRDTVLTMDMVNPFPYAMGRRPAVGGVAAAAYRYTLSDAHRPSDEGYFGNADIVMVPKMPASHPGYFNGFYEMYEPALHDHFRLSAESDMWYLYRRK
ncbi:MAG TPA: hypothetical protein VE131_10635 [Terriglobales bacterium]|nr:hypothetical protein [Terriglobales bacterium]